MFDIYTWSVLITGIFYISFGIFAYVKNRELSTRLFTLVSISFAVWNLSWFFLLKSSSFENAFLFAKLLTFGATFIPIFYMHWVLSIVNLHKKRKIILILGYFITIIFAFLSLSDLYISGVQPILFFPFWPVAGPAFTLFILMGYTGMVLYALFELIRGYRNNTGDKRYQIGYLILGSLLGFGGGATNFPLMYGVSAIQPFGIFLTMASPFIFSYAAVKYRFMEIKVVATQFFAGVINIIFIINLILSKDFTELFFNVFLLIFVFVFTILLIKGVRKEILQREKIELLVKDLEVANNQQEGLIHFITHQIKGFLSKSRNIYSMALDGDYGLVNDDLKKIMKEGLDSETKGIDLVKEILDSANLKKGTMQYTMAIFDLKPLVTDIVAEQKQIAEAKGLDLEIDIMEGDYNMLGDAEQIKHVIKNLIDNSVKYTENGSVKINLSRSGEKILFTVKDTGIGITQEDKARLFTAGGRGKDSLKTNIESTGFGLFIAKKIVDDHKGRIWAESDGVGKGSQFNVELLTK